jgi:PAS domain S-box-containing protein
VITKVNDNFCTISQYKREELIGKNSSILNSDFHPLTFFTQLWNTITTGKVWRGEIRNKAKYGEIFWLDTTIVPFLDENQQPVKYLAIQFDITHRKTAEIRLIELNEDLQNKAKALSESNADLEQFAYVASHDLQEPLRMISSFLTLLEKKYANIIDENGKKYIDFAVDGSKRMRQIILDLLEFSRVGKNEDSQAAIDLNEIINEIRLLFGKQISDKSATITAENLPVIFTHRTIIRQVLQNLVSNALKYCREGVPVQIEISVSETTEEWQFAIKDNGIGIKEEFFNKIFIIFQRLHTREEYAGTGLGLAITKKIIESKGGKIWLQSEENCGSTFYFTLKKMPALQ